MQKHNDDTTTSGHSSLEKYTSHFIEMVVCERELKTEQRLQHIDHLPTLLAITAFYPVLLGCSTGGLVLIPASSLQPIWTSCRRGYIIIWHPPTPCERHNSHSIQPLDSQSHPWSPDIFDQMHLLFTPVHFFFWQLGRVGGQYATGSLGWVWSLLLITIHSGSLMLMKSTRNYHVTKVPFHGYEYIPKLPFHPGSLWSRVVVSVRAPSIDQIEQFKNYLYLIGILDTIICMWIISSKNSYLEFAKDNY